jgi:toxin ParE1/3/4
VAQVIWTEPALSQLEDVAEYIALDNPGAASALVQSVFEQVERLERFPHSGREPPELPNSVYREVVVVPCRLFYRVENEKVFILHVMRHEQQLRQFLLR